MSFPAHSGTVVPLDALVATRMDGGEAEGGADRARILRGNLLYSPRAVPDEVAIGSGEHGCLYMLLNDYDGSDAPECAELLRVAKKPGAAGFKFHCDLGSRRQKGASLDVGSRRYRPYASELWVVNHFSSLKRATPGAPGLWNHVNFDFEAAEREIRRRRNCLNLDVVEEELKLSLIHISEPTRPY